jgi:hypothetical protein
VVLSSARLSLDLRKSAKDGVLSDVGALTVNVRFDCESVDSLLLWDTFLDLDIVLSARGRSDECGG